LLPAIVCIFRAIKTIRDFRLAKANRSLVTSATAAAISWALVIVYLAYVTESQDLETLTFFNSSVEFPVVVLVAAFVGVLVYASYVLTHDNFVDFFQIDKVDGETASTPAQSTHGKAAADRPHEPTETVTAAATTKAIAVTKGGAAERNGPTVMQRMKTLWGRAIISVAIPHTPRDPFRSTRERVLLDLGNHITIAPYVALVAVLVLGQGTGQSARTTVFLAFFTGLWIKPVLAALSTFGKKLLPASDSTGGAASADAAAKVSAATGVAASAAAASAAAAAANTTTAVTQPVKVPSDGVSVGNGQHVGTASVVEALKSLSR